MNAEQTLVAAIVALTPVAIKILRAQVPRLPKWSLPILAPIVGGLAEALFAAIPGLESGSGMLVGALAGLAGTGLREIADQAGKAIRG